MIKLIINAVVSRRDAWLIRFDIKSFYLETPIWRSEYVRIDISNIPQDFIDEYDLTTHIDAMSGSI